MDEARARTVRAALLALAIGWVGIGAVGMFVGLPAGVAWGSGGVFGAMMGLLVLAAARRSDSFEGPAPPSPRSPHGRRAAGDDVQGGHDQGGQDQSGDERSAT